MLRTVDRLLPITARDFQSVLLIGINQKEPLPDLRVRARSSSVQDVNLLNCMDTSNSMELAAAPAPPRDSSEEIARVVVKWISIHIIQILTSILVKWISIHIIQISPASSSNRSVSTSSRYPPASSSNGSYPYHPDLHPKSHHVNLLPLLCTFHLHRSPMCHLRLLWALPPVNSQSSLNSAHLSGDVPVVCSDGQICSPPLVARRVKKPFNFKC